MPLSLESFFSIGDKACENNNGAIGFRCCDGLKSCSGNMAVIGIFTDAPDTTGSTNDKPKGSCKSDIKEEGDEADPAEYRGACERNTAKIGDDSW